MGGETSTAGPEAPERPIEAADAGRPAARGFLRSPGFSVAAGIVAPIVCLALQPLLLADMFITTLPGLGFINASWIFGYGVIGLEMLVLAVWLAFGPRLGAGNAPISGALFAGALFAGGLGLVLLPFSLVGLIVLIGALGLVPFLTAAVYWANAVEAYRRAVAASGGRSLLGPALLGGMLILGVPGAAQAAVSMAVRHVIRDVAAGDPTAMARLRTWLRFTSPDRLAWAYAAERDPARRKRLADAYRELTGDEVEWRLSILND